MLDVTGGTAKIVLKLGVDNGAVLCYYMSVDKDTEYEVREEHKMDRKVEYNAQAEYDAGYNEGMQDRQDKMSTFYGMTRTSEDFCRGYDDGYEKGAQLSRDIHEAKARDRVHRMEHVADTLRQLGFDVSVSPDGLTLHYEYEGEVEHMEAIFVPTKFVAALASGLRDLKALGVL